MWGKKKKIVVELRPLQFEHGFYTDVFGTGDFRLYTFTLAQECTSDPFEFHTIEIVRRRRNNHEMPEIAIRLITTAAIAIGSARNFRNDGIRSSKVSRRDFFSKGSY